MLYILIIWAGMAAITAIMMGTTPKWASLMKENEFGWFGVFLAYTILIVASLALWPITIWGINSKD